VSVQNGTRRVRKMAKLHGQPVRTLVQARSALQILGGEVHKGIDTSATKQRLTIDQVLDGLVAHWKTAGPGGGPTTSLTKASSQVKALRKAFGAMKARAWRYQHGADYLATGTTQAQRGTLSYRLSILRTGFKIALRNDLLDRVPPFPERVDNVRQGYLTPEVFGSLAAEFSGVDAEILRFAYESGQRIQRILDLHVTDVDTIGWTIYGEPDRGNKARPAVPLVGPARAIVETRLKAAVGPGWHLFHKGGRRISYESIREAWRDAMVAKGLPYVIHDFRRSCARNLVNAGVSPAVAMRITGHRSLTTFIRYAINPDEAMRDALVKRDNYVADRLAESCPGPVLSEPAGQ
jgi:integrase